MHLPGGALNAWNTAISPWRFWVHVVFVVCLFRNLLNSWKPSPRDSRSSLESWSRVLCCSPFHRLGIFAPLRADFIFKFDRWSWFSFSLPSQFRRCLFKNLSPSHTHTHTESIRLKLHYPFALASDIVYLSNECSAATVISRKLQCRSQCQQYYMV